MPSSASIPDIFRYITPRRAEVFAALADGATIAETARRLDISLNGTRSHVADLKKVTGCSSARELGRWWRQNRVAWVLWLAELADCAQFRAGNRVP